ncbi:hypothetical protein [Methylobacterium sp. R2-1]|uniref:hypothetical protein n=1 Tax=Methylobacterium sp. R2-1 TaxID=2587064 RepID=UPI00160AD50E|nr:hypothetical protein [Methylobacterium sp. R2-1]MBB2964738.1 hypothetical protein [Methylobacterium sp. R2-1]
MLVITIFDDRQDDFWRQTLAQGVGNQKAFLAKYEAFVKGMQADAAHLPQAEQDAIFGRVVARNAEYMALAQVDREALKAKLGMPNSFNGPNSLGKVAAETAVRATVWNSVGALFRLFR